ncbi:hypothetical protein SUGI_0367560 [Cryptomeria japonica]|nr:hypothetical protein SUGI_0367560 [Cryptomeria japonica]
MSLVDVVVVDFGEMITKEMNKEVSAVLSIKKDFEWLNKKLKNIRDYLRDADVHAEISGDAECKEVCSKSEKLPNKFYLQSYKFRFFLYFLAFAFVSGIFGKLGGIIIEQINKEVAPDLSMEEDAISTNTFDNVEWRRTTMVESQFDNQIHRNFTIHCYEKSSMVSHKDFSSREDPAMVAFNQLNLTSLPIEQAPSAHVQSAAPKLPIEIDAPSTRTSKNVKWRTTSVIESNFNNQISMVSNQDSNPREDPAIIVFDQSRVTPLTIEQAPHQYIKNMVSSKKISMTEDPSIMIDQLRIAPIPIEQAPLALSQSTTPNLPTKEDAPFINTSENVKWKEKYVIENNLDNQIISNNLTPYPYQKMSMVPKRDSTPREDPAIVVFDQPEAAPIPREKPPIVLAQSTTIEDVLNLLIDTHTQNSPSVIQVALALFVASLTLMLAMLDKRDNSISFNIFFITSMLALVTSLAVAMILAFDPPRKVAWLMKIITWVAAACFLLAFLAIGFFVRIPAVKWIVASFAGVGAMVMALLLYRAFIFPPQMSQLHQGFNVV